MSQTENLLHDISPEQSQEQNEISVIRDSLIRTEKGNIPLLKSSKESPSFPRQKSYAPAQRKKP